MLCSYLSVFIPTVKGYVNPEWTLQWETDLSYLPPVTYNGRTFYDNSLVMPVLYDVTGDGIQEVFITKGYPDDVGYEGSNTHNSGDVWCLNGATGAVIWHYGPTWYIGNHAIMCIHDLDGDGDMELLVCGYHKTTAFHAENGQVLWNENDSVHRHDKPAVVLKENGIVYVYTTMNTCGTIGGIQKRLGSTGAIVAQTIAPIYHPCYGGLSAADINCDGQIEILLGDRSTGVGLSCFKSSDLSLIWNYPAVACSTQTPCILDVDGDEGLDIIVNNQATRKIFAVDGFTHQPIWSWEKGYWPWPGDIFMSAIYDVDKDGHLEDINCAECGPTPMYVYDLTTGALDATLYRSDGLGLPFPPIIANVYGNSDLEIVNTYAYEGIDVWDSNYDLVAIAPHFGNIHTISLCMTIIDMDDDGYNEIIQLCHKDGTGYSTYATVQVIHTNGLVATPKATAKDFGYTYKRSLVSQYVQYDDPDNIPMDWTLFVSVPEGHGNVTKNPDKVYYQTGEVVTLHAIACPSWEFDYWSGDLSGKINPVNITISSNMSVFAYFAYNISQGTTITNLQPKWNLLSLPYNLSINKNEITVLLNGTNFNWSQATTCNNPTGEPILLGDIFTYDGMNKNYQDVNTLFPGKGYWLYAFHPCKLWDQRLIGENTNNTITALQTEWNIIGLPHNTTVPKEQIIIYYNGGEYNWTQATTSNNPTGEPIINNFFYNWERTNQQYITNNTLLPGYAYWIYSYRNCTLYRP